MVKVLFLAQRNLEYVRWWKPEPDGQFEPSCPKSKGLGQVKAPEDLDTNRWKKRAVWFHFCRIHVPRIKLVIKCVGKLGSKWKPMNLCHNCLPMSFLMQNECLQLTLLWFSTVHGKMLAHSLQCYNQLWNRVSGRQGERKATSTSGL